MSTLCTLQEEQVRLKMRLQELQQLKRELRNSPKDKLLIKCFNKRNIRLTWRSAGCGYRSNPWSYPW
uniref:Uncharacterized protein n=1 Tax=Spermophilus dauricus TaxID=99837 RepID=A0A8C9PQB7_SPEDA